MIIIIIIIIITTTSVQCTVGVLHIELNCGGRKPDCLEKTLKVRLRSTETQSTYNIVVEVEGVTDVHCASLTSQGVQHRYFI